MLEDSFQELLDVEFELLDFLLFFLDGHLLFEDFSSAVLYLQTVLFAPIDLGGKVFLDLVEAGNQAMEEMLLFLVLVLQVVDEEGAHELLPHQSLGLSVGELFSLDFLQHLEVFLLRKDIQALDRHFDFLAFSLQLLVELLALADYLSQTDFEVPRPLVFVSLLQNQPLHMFLDFQLLLYLLQELEAVIVQPLLEALLSREF